jgi:Rieske Fe-S protein
MAAPADMPETTPNPRRRQILKWSVGIVSVFWGIMALVPIYRYLRPKQTGSGTSQTASVTVGPVASVPVGSGKNFEFGSIPGILTHTADGQFHAFNAVCTHLGCTVQFRGDMNRIWCACHGGQYDPATGEVLAGPPPRPLEPLRVNVAGGNIVVSSARAGHG